MYLGGRDTTNGDLGRILKNVCDDGGIAKFMLNDINSTIAPGSDSMKYVQASMEF
jgi:chemotaxis receptor (MCP) glutamine deamidase CheD